MSDTTLQTAGERSMKTEEHDNCSDFQRFFSAAIKLDEFNEPSTSAYRAAVVVCVIMQFYWKNCSVKLASL